MTEKTLKGLTVIFWTSVVGVGLSLGISIGLTVKQHNAQKALEQSISIPVPATAQ